MAEIKINNLSEFEFDGNELFQDSESFLNELTDVELTINKGSSSPACVGGVLFLIAVLSPNDAGSSMN